MSPDFLSLPDTILWQRARGYCAERDWYMVHEALEVLWKRGGKDAGFYQALLQAAVSLYHYGNGNFSGARQLAKSALERLGALPDELHGIDVKRYRAEFAAVTAPLLDDTTKPRPLDPSSAPVWP